MVFQSCAFLGQRETKLTTNRFVLPRRKDDSKLEDFIYLKRYNHIRVLIDKGSSCSIPFEQKERIIPNE